LNDKEHLKLCAARYVWRIQNERIPFPIPNENGKKIRYTWKEWWEYKFKDSYEVYTDGLRNSSKRKRPTRSCNGEL